MNPAKKNAVEIAKLEAEIKEIHRDVALGRGTHKQLRLLWKKSRRMQMRVRVLKGEIKDFMALI